MLVVDLWCGQSNGRAALFVDCENTLALNAIFIEFAGMFLFDGDGKRFCLEKARYTDERLYGDTISQPSVEMWLDRIANVKKKDLTEILLTLPEGCFRRVYAHSLISLLMARQRALPVWFKREFPSFRDKLLKERDRRNIGIGDNDGDDK